MPPPVVANRDKSLFYAVGPYFREYVICPEDGYIPQYATAFSWACTTSNLVSSFGAHEFNDYLRMPAKSQYN